MPEADIQKQVDDAIAAATKQPAQPVITELDGIKDRVKLFNSQLKFALKQAKESISRSLRMLSLPLVFSINTSIAVDIKACTKKVANEIKAAFAENNKVAFPIVPVEDEPKSQQESESIDKH